MTDGAIGLWILGNSEVEIATEQSLQLHRADKEKKTKNFRALFSELRVVV